MGKPFTACAQNERAYTYPESAIRDAQQEAQTHARILADQRRGMAAPSLPLACTPRRGPPSSGLTKNELAVLSELRQVGEGLALTTTQLASMTSMHTSSAANACQRLVVRGLIRRHEPSTVLGPVSWSLGAA